MTEPRRSRRTLYLVLALILVGVLAFGLWRAPIVQALYIERVVEDVEAEVRAERSSDDFGCELDVRTSVRWNGEVVITVFGGDPSATAFYQRLEERLAPRDRERIVEGSFALTSDCGTGF